MVQPRDWLPPLPPAPENEAYNRAHREGYEQCAAMMPHSNHEQRTAFANGYARAKERAA